MEKIFCDFCTKEINTLISTIEYKTNFLKYDRIEEVIISQDTTENRYDLCAECNQDFQEYLNSKMK